MIEGLEAKSSKVDPAEVVEPITAVDDAGFAWRLKANKNISDRMSAVGGQAENPAMPRVAQSDPKLTVC